MAKKKQKTESLADLPFERLKAVVSARLHGIQSIGPAFDSRIGEVPFEWLSAEYSRGSDGLRDRMNAAMRELLDELTDVQQWNEDARGELLALIQDYSSPLWRQPPARHLPRTWRLPPNRPPDPACRPDSALRRA